MRKILSVALLLILAYLMIVNITGIDINTRSKDYYIEHTASEVSSQNIVTGIYLDYRLFDSLFEVGTLLVASAGVIFMAIKDEDMIEGD